jgi:hypothetical protein
MSQLIHKELTYIVRGVLFDVYNKLGPKLPENFYQKAITYGLSERRVGRARAKPTISFYLLCVVYDEYMVAVGFTSFYPPYMKYLSESARAKPTISFSSSWCGF